MTSAGAGGDVRRLTGALRKGLILVLLGAIAALVVRDGLVRHFLANTDPAHALAIAPGSPTAAAAAAEVALRDGDVRAAFELSDRALAGSPLLVQALRVNGLASERLGMGDRALALLSLAGRRSWRDTQTQAWLFDQGLRAGDYEAAVQRADALLRRNRVGTPLIQLLLDLASVPEARPSLAKHLAMAPPWRASLFRAAGQIAPGREGDIGALARELIVYDARPTSAELAPLLKLLVARDRVLDAHRLWRGLIAEAAGDRLITDGGFAATDPAMATTDDASPFAWSIDRRFAGEVIVAQPPFANSAALAVDPSEEGEALVAEQILVVTPGRYALVARTAGETGDASASLALRLSCLRDPVPLAETRPSDATEGSWATIAAVAIIPDASCMAQRLQLIVRTTDPRAVERIWIDDIRLLPAAAGPSPG